MAKITFDQLVLKVLKLEDELKVYKMRLTESTEPKYKIGEYVVVNGYSQYEAWGNIVEVYAQSTGWHYVVNCDKIHEYRRVHEGQVSRKL